MRDCQICDCELRNRKWNPNTGVCGFCSRIYVDPRCAENNLDVAVKGLPRLLPSSPNSTSPGSNAGLVFFG
jgi:hypothetical protein